MDVHAKLKKVKNYIEYARGELSAIRNEFKSSYNVNGSYIEKSSIDKLDSKFQSMIYSLNNRILPLADSSDDDIASSKNAPLTSKTGGIIRRYFQ